MTRNCQTIFGFPCLIHHLASSCILFLKIDSNKVQQKFQSQTLSKKVIFVSYSLNPFLPKTQSQMRPDQAGRQRFVTSIVNEATSQKTAETQLNDGHNLPPSPLTVGIGLTYLTKKMWRRASSVPFMLLQPWTPMSTLVYQISTTLSSRLDLQLVIMMTWICLHFCFQLECYQISEN